MLSRQGDWRSVGWVTPPSVARIRSEQLNSFSWSRKSRWVSPATKLKPSAWLRAFSHLTLLAPTYLRPKCMLWEGGGSLQKKTNSLSHHNPVFSINREPFKEKSPSPARQTFPEKFRQQVSHGRMWMQPPGFPRSCSQLALRWCLLATLWLRHTRALFFGEELWLWKLSKASGLLCPQPCSWCGTGMWQECSARTNFSVRCSGENVRSRSYSDVRLCDYVSYFTPFVYIFRDIKCPIKKWSWSPFDFCCWLLEN